HERESQRDRGSAGRVRLPHRLAREGVPDGGRGCVERRHHPRSGVRGGWAMTNRVLHHILTVTVENKPGVLSRVAGLFSRRAFNIVSLAVSPTDDERFSRMTIVVDAESAPLEQVVKQLNKLIPVIKITEAPPSAGVGREVRYRVLRASATLVTPPTRRDCFRCPRPSITKMTPISA